MMAISLGQQKFVLWNPAIRKSVGIRVPYMSHKPIENLCDIEVHDAFGFGVCPVAFDLTIIKIRCIHYKRNRRRNDKAIVNVPWKVQVFTLSTGTWSILSTNLPRESVRPRGAQVVIDRFIYWVAYEVGRSEPNLLIMFDLTAKELKEINLTDSFTNRRCSIESISKLRESLVLLEYHLEEDVSVGCLWMMKEQGVSRSSFTKMYTIKLPDATIHHILGFRKTGDLIMETIPNYEKYGEVQIYKQNYEYADNLGIDGEDNSFFMCSYVESLLLLDKSDGYIYLPIVRT
uniref:uncharacterized protein LOC122584366 n=1 Tax=Erigeron canadensis TaxID=72917 RepID=UPI001CB980A0|nr:uncharacterized protein LOC122584366 [Erigeron canadensis]